MSDTETIKSKVDIVGLIGESVALKKAGRNFKGLCPFHKEKTPSFMVSPDRQTYYCFGCQEGGDIFEFVMKREAADFPEALQMLAKRAGVELKGYDHEKTKGKKRLFEVNEQAANYFQAALKHAAGKMAAAYLEQRGIKPETIEAFRVGFAPDDYDALTAALRKKKFTDKEMVDAGVAGRGRSLYARFRNRLMIPIADSSGVTRGFTGRILDDSKKEAKYVNTPETSVYHKGRLVFGLHNAKQAIIEHDAVVLVEGQMDVLSAWQAGTKHVAATSGTATTEEQIRQLNRFTKNVVLAFDADAAGRKAMARLVELVGDRDVELKVADLGDAKDPDDLISQSPDAWKKAVETALPVVDYLINKTTSEFERPYTREAIGKVLDEVLPVLKHRSALDQDYYLEQLGATLGLEKSAIKPRLDRIGQPPGAPAPTDAPQPVRKRPEDLVSERLLGLVLSTKELEPKFEEIDPRIFPEMYRTAAEKIKASYTGTDIGDGNRSLLDICLLAAAEYEPLSPAERAAEFDRLYARLKLLWAKQHQPKLLAAIKRAEDSGDRTRRNRLMEEYTTLTKRIAHG